MAEDVIRNARVESDGPSEPGMHPVRRPLIIGAILTALAAVLLALRGGRASEPPPADFYDRMPPVSAPPPVPGDRLAHNGIFAALGRGTYRARRWLPLVGLAAVIGLNVWASTASARLSQGGWQVPGSEAARADALFADRFGEQATTMIVLFTDPDGDAASEEFQATVADAVEPLADEPIVDEILTYASIGDPSFVSTDGSKTFAVVQLNQELDDAIDDAEHLGSLVDVPAGVEATITGIPMVQHEFNEAIERDLMQAEIIS